MTGLARQAAPPRLSLIRGGKPDLPDTRAADRALARRIADGDDAALASVYTEHATALTRFVERWLGDPNDAADIVHETMLELWRRADRYAGRSSLRTFIFTIARNKAVDRNRKMGRLVYTEVADERVATEPDPASALSALEDSERLARAMEGLSDPHRRVLHLAFFEDLPYAEIARIENCPEGTVKSRVLHAKRKLMQLIAPD